VDLDRGRQSPSIAGDVHARRWWPDPLGSGVRYAAAELSAHPRPIALWRLALAVVLAISTVGRALAGSIEPDRPELTESARLVPRGSLQLETGVAFSGERRAATSTEHRFDTEADLRIGVTRQIEVDLEGEPFVRVRGPQDDTGFGDITLGVRYRFVEAFEDALWPPSLAVKPFVKFPVASKPIGSGRLDAGVLLLGSFTLPWEFEIEVNLGGAAIGQTRPNGYLGQAIATASLSRDLTPALNGFFEVLWSSREERGDTAHFAINTGVVYRVTPRLAVDAGVQTSLVGRGPDYIVRAGLSVRFRR